MAPQEQRDLNNFLMDLEHYVLQHRWDARIGIPCGPQRHLDHLWGQVMEEEMKDYPRRTYEEYCEWVESGGGDEWFQEDQEGIIDQGYLEAQAKQRTSYLCRDMVAPLSVSLHERIVPLALAQRRSVVTLNGRGEPPANLRRVGQAGG